MLGPRKAGSHRHWKNVLQVQGGQRDPVIHHNWAKKNFYNMEAHGPFMNGRKFIGNWGYFTLLIQLINPVWIFLPCRWLKVLFRQEKGKVFCKHPAWGTLYRTQITSILKVNSPLPMPFPSKTHVIWVPGGLFWNVIWTPKQPLREGGLGAVGYNWGTLKGMNSFPLPGGHFWVDDVPFLKVG